MRTGMSQRDVSTKYAGRMRRMDIIRRAARSLLAVTVAMFASSVQLEATGGRYAGWVWAHICLGLIFFGLILWHLWLHFPLPVWGMRLWRSNAPDMRWLTALMLLTLISAIIAAGGWIASPTHSIAGAIHGKIGFVAIALVVWHIARRIKFFCRK